MFKNILLSKKVQLKFVKEIILENGKIFVFMFYQILIKFKKYYSCEYINSFYISRDIFINKIQHMKSGAWAQDECPYKEDVIVSDSTTSGGIELIEQKLNKILETPVDTKVLIEVTRLNRGDASQAIALAVDRLQQKATEDDLKQLQDSLEKQVKAELIDANKKRDIRNSKHEVIVSIEQKLKTVNFDNNQILPCLKSNFTQQIQANLKQFVSDLISKCDGGPKYVDLKPQIMKIISILCPKIKNQEAEVNYILANKNFENIQKITTLNKFEQNRFISHVNCLKTFQQYLKCGESLSECRNKFVLSTAKQLLDLASNWDLLSDVLEKLIEDPLFDFSKCQKLTNETKQNIYDNVYNSKQFIEYLNITNHLKSSKFKQNKDIESIIKLISDWVVKPNQQKQLKEYLKSYNFVKFYSDPNIGQAKMPKIHKFIIQNCKDYVKYQRQQQNSPDEIRPKLIAGLRQFLLKIGIPFGTHTEIQQLVFSRKLYDLLSTAISSTQKKLLFEWISSHMSQFYKKQFNSVNLREETKDYLIDIFIKMDQEFNYKVINEVVENFLNNVDAKYLTSSGNFTDTQRKQVRKTFKDDKIVKRYIDNLGIDTTSVKFNTENTLVCDIMVPNQIGCLHAGLTEKTALNFLENPESETIRSSDLPQSQKKTLITETENKLKAFKSQMKKVSAGVCIKKYQEYVKNNFDAAPIYKDAIWRAIQNYGFLKQDEDDNLDMEDDGDDFQQIKQMFEQDQSLKKSLRAIQQSQQFHQFKFQFPELSGKKFKQIEEDLSVAFKKQLLSKRFDQDAIEQFQKAVETASYKLQLVQQMGKYKKMASLCSNISSYNSYKNKKQSSLSENQFLKSIQDQQRLVKILKQNPCFDKYLSNQKHQIICMFRKNGSQFISEAESILTKNDLEVLIRQFCIQENQQQQYQQKKPKQQKPKQEKQKPEMSKADSKKQQVAPKTPKADNKGKKSVPVGKWKEGVKKICNKTYEQVVASLELTKLIGQNLKAYQEKGQIIAEYKATLEQQQKKAAEEFLKEVEDPKNESHIKSLANYDTEIKNNINIIIEDFVWDPKTAEVLKPKYGIINAKIKKLQEQFSGPRKDTLNKLTSLREELKRLQEISK